MLNEEYIKKRHENMIKASYIENFQREITSEELAEVFTYLLPRMQSDLKELKGYSDTEFERYMSSKSNQLLFSPGNIIGELNRVIENDGVDKLTTARKYKRLREMEVATRYCFANYKKTGDMLMIQPQDNPDIILALLGNKSSNKQVLVSRLEIMTIPEIAKGKLQGDLPIAITNFVKEKKFLKDYGEHCSLLICLDFTQEALNINKIAEELRKEKSNPYYSILLTFNNDEDRKIMSVIQIYPSVIRIDYNLESEPELLY